MIVYGDQCREQGAREVVARILRLTESWCVEACVSPASASPPRMRCSDRATELLIEVGSLVQALLDRDFAQRGEDDWTPLHGACSELLLWSGKLYLTGAN